MGGPSEVSELKRRAQILRKKRCFKDRICRNFEFSQSSAGTVNEWNLWRQIGVSVDSKNSGPTRVFEEPNEFWIPGSGDRRYFEATNRSRKEVTD